MRGIDVAFGDRAILENVSLTVRRGELVSLLGLSGSGKTTLFNVISGLLCPDAGSVWLEGREITGQTGQIAYMLQKDLLLRHLKIVDNVALPLLLQGLPRAAAREEAARHFADFGLAGTEHLYSELSGGMANARPCCARLGLEGRHAPRQALLGPRCPDRASAARLVPEKSARSWNSRRFSSPMT